MRILLLVVSCCLAASFADAATIRGTVRDTNGGALPGVTIELASGGVAVTGADGRFVVDAAAGAHALTFRLLNFTAVRRTVTASNAEAVMVDVVLPLEASASIVVTGKQTFRNLADLDEPLNGMVGIADAASVGVVTAKQLEARAERRPGDVLETIPGVVISQHSGEGKANQYYLRGFNLDHGTDFATTVAGAPVNMPTHAHGQGYADNNFLIPELISGVQYRKGPYYADAGDFSSAGTANINYVNFLEQPIASITGGSFGYARIFTAGSTPWRNGQLLGALELSHNEGPWERPDDYRKVNGVARFTSGSERSAYSITLAGYDGEWNATDQIPNRAVRDGLSRFAAIDQTNGGDSHRYSLAGDWQRRGDRALTKASAYVIAYELDLFSNFTYYLDDPVNGDQFEQADRRVVAGGRSTQQWLANVLGRSAEHLVGVDLRHDRIGNVGLYRTRARQRLETIREDRVRQTSVGAFAQTSIQWRETLRSVTGVRVDGYRFAVEGVDRVHDALLSPKLSLIAGPWRSTEVYASAATGFHSNDGRGALGGDPLVRTKGAELGVRTTAIPRLQSTLALWGLDIASELLFVGDAGTTEASRPSRRVGLEWSNYYRVTDHIVLDADLAWSRARFTDGDLTGSRIPGALEGVVSTGVSLYDLGRVSGSLRYRWLGSRPLLENDSVRSRASSHVSASLGYAVTRRHRIVVEGLNLLDARVSDIDYYYASRLPGEPEGGVEDVHTHPVEPRSIRVRVEMTF